MTKLLFIILKYTKESTIKTGRNNTILPHKALNVIPFIIGGALKNLPRGPISSRARIMCPTQGVAMYLPTSWVPEGYEPTNQIQRQ